MGALKIVGGILAVAGAGLILVLQIMELIGYGFTLALFYTMILPIVALVGGILALAGKRAGGIIALVVGIIWVTVAILINLDIVTFPLDLYYLLAPIPVFSFFLIYLGFTIWGLLTVETILVFVGGILATAGGSD
jgi:hypothetical protein